MRLLNGIYHYGIHRGMVKIIKQIYRTNVHRVIGNDYDCI